jgi:hypothetical protein
MGIVERLRDYTYEGDTWQLQQEAAEEIERLRQQLYEVSLSWLEGQAREAKLREALNVLFERYKLLDRHLVIDGCVGGVFGAVKEALALPTDDTALKEALKEEYEQGYRCRMEDEK